MLVTLTITKLLKENESDGESLGFSEYTQN